MALIAGLTTATALLGVALVHAYWARGGRWPATARAGLADMVIGPNLPMPTPPAVWAVATLLTVSAALIAAQALGIDHWIAQVGTVIAAVVLAVRSVAGFVASGIIRRDSAFAKLDRWIYSPLCAALAAGAVLALG